MPSTALLDAIAALGFAPDVLDGVLPVIAGSGSVAPVAEPRLVVAPAATVTLKESIMSNEITPAPAKGEKVERPLRKLTTKELCERVDQDDETAAAEAVLRFAHQGTLQPQNRRMIARALAGFDERGALAGIPSEIDAPEVPVKAPAPEVSPEVAKGATEFAKRIKALVEKDRIKASIRARKLALSEGLTLEDVQGASDKELLEFLAGA